MIVFCFFFWKKKKTHPKKIIKLDPLQQTLFCQLGQQIWLTPTTKSVTADEGDLDNDSSPEPTKQQTKKVSALYNGLVKTDKMSVLNYVSKVFDFFFFFFWFGFYGPFKNISLISSRSFIEGGRKPENPEKNHLTIRKHNLAFPHMTQARLEPQRWET